MNRRHFSVNDWVIDHHSGSICHLITQEQKRLGEYQLKLLDILAQNAGVILTREVLTTQVWERRVIGNNSLPNAIHALRAALEDDGKKQKIIKTIPRKGYLLESDYCRLIEKEESEIRYDTLNMSTVEEPPRQDVPATETQVADSVREDVLLTPEPLLLLSVLKFQRWCNAILLVMVTMLITGLALWQYFTYQQNGLLYEQPGINAYSNACTYENSRSLPESMRAGKILNIGGVNGNITP